MSIGDFPFRAFKGLFNHLLLFSGLANIRENKALPANRKATLLTRPFPRFIWCATALAGNDKVFDFLFDATDIEQGQCLVGVVEHDKKLSEVLHEVFSDANVETLLGNRHRFAAAIARWFRMHPFDEMWN